MLDPMIWSAIITGGSQLLQGLAGGIFGGQQAEREEAMQKDLLQMKLAFDEEERERRNAQWAAMREALNMLLVHRPSGGYSGTPAPAAPQGVMEAPLLSPRPFGRRAGMA